MVLVFSEQNSMPSLNIIYRMKENNFNIFSDSLSIKEYTHLTESGKK